MILNISGRTDIIAFYTPWLLNRLKEGYIDVRNPFYQKNISRIYLEDIDAIIFCTKNPHPILNHLNKITKPFLFHVTLTPYKKDIEPNVPPKGKIIEDIKTLSSLMDKENLYVRYDPIFINHKYTIDYHIKAFDHLCKLLDGYVSHIIISFLDDYKNVRKNYGYLMPKTLTKEDYKQIGENFYKSAKKHNITIQTCAEKEDLTQYGFIKQDCLSKEIAKRLTGKETFKKWTARGKCNCVQMTDIGVYNTCHHMCKYCYANFEEDKVKTQKHDPGSSLLIGHIQKDDIIKIKEK